LNSNKGGEELRYQNSRKTRITWDKLDDQETAAKFQEAAMANLRELMSIGTTMAKAFSKAIVQVAEQTCAEDTPIKEGWFVKARTILKPLIKARNKANKWQKEAPLETNKESFNSARVLLNKECREQKTGKNLTKQQGS
jgi:hypothetical protein